MPLPTEIRPDVELAGSKEAIRTQGIIRRAFSDPLAIPSEWKNWLRSYLEMEPPRILATDLGSSQFDDLTVDGDLKVTSWPTVKVYRTNALAVANGAFTAITWEAEEYDNRSMWGSGTTVVAPVAGIYHVAAGVVWDANSAGVLRAIGIARGGAHQMQSRIHPTGAHAPGPTVGGDILCAANDGITVEAYQDSGANLNILGGITNCWFTMHLVRAT